MTSVEPPASNDAAAIGVWDVLAFLCELAMLVALAVGGWNVARHGLDAGPVVAGLVAAALPLLAATAWGLWLSPRSTRAPGPRAALLAKAALFVLAGVVLALPPGHGHPWWGLALVAVALLDLAVIGFSRGRGPSAGS